MLVEQQTWMITHGVCKNRKKGKQRGKKKENMKKKGIFPYTEVSFQIKKEKMLEENDTRREQDFSAKVNSNADKKLKKKKKKSQRKSPTPDIPCTSFYLLPFFPIQQKNLEFAMKVKNGVR